MLLLLLLLLAVHTHSDITHSLLRDISRVSLSTTKTCALTTLYGRQRHWRTWNVHSGCARRLAASGGRRECPPRLHGFASNIPWVLRPWTLVSVGGLTQLHNLASPLETWISYAYRCLRSAASSLIVLRIVSDSQPFRSRANSLPGANRPIKPWLIRSLELSFPAHSLPGPLAPWNLRSQERKFQGMKWPGNERARERKCQGLWAHAFRRQ